MPNTASKDVDTGVLGEAKRAVFAENAKPVCNGAGRRRRSIRWLTAGLGMSLVVLMSANLVAADDTNSSAPPLGMPDRKMVRFEFDNDVALGSDDAFTAGWSIQLHSPLLDSWPRPFPEWTGRLPGLGDDGEGGRVVRWSLGLSQIMATPHDVTIAEPQPDDVPWAGILGVHGGLSSYDNRRLTAVQLYLGCMGPCSQADDLQRFVHDDLGASSSSPAGWSNQLDTKILGNLNIAWSGKLWAPHSSAYAAGRWAQDFAIGGQLGVGNLATFARAQLEYRFGLGLPMGFTHIPDPPGFGIALDPAYFPRDQPLPTANRWRGYASVVVRASYYEYLAPAEGGPTENGGYHPGIDPNFGQPEVLVGLHVGRAPVALHLTYYRYLLGSEEVGLTSSNDWMNLSLEVRF